MINNMADFSGTERDRKNKIAVHKEAWAKYLYDMSKICFASVFVVNITDLLKAIESFSWQNPLVWFSIAGLIFGLALARAAHITLKY